MISLLCDDPAFQKQKSFKNKLVIVRISLASWSFIKYICDLKSELIVLLLPTIHEPFSRHINQLNEMVNA